MDRHVMLIIFAHMQQTSQQPLGPWYSRAYLAFTVPTGHLRHLGAMPGGEHWNIGNERTSDQAAGEERVKITDGLRSPSGEVVQILRCYYDVARGRQTSIKILV